MIEKVFIKNFRIFEEFTLTLNPDLNIIVGNNEAGKSTILEAISLALTKRTGGRLIDYEISPHLFNRACSNSYIKACREKRNPELPKILIELYLSDRPELQNLRGSNNSAKEDSVGIKLEIAFDEDYKAEYAKLIEDPNQPKAIPAEYYRAYWYSFANRSITSRSLQIVSSLIDATTIRLQSGTDYYLQNIINDKLDPKEKVALTIAYRQLKEQFSEQPSIKSINANLNENKGAISKKDLAITIDVSQKSNWENGLVPHLDELPFHLIGMGEQSTIKILLALENKKEESQVILIEEPENHLSFSTMNILLSRIQEKCKGKQIIVATHSAYVLNKLGIEKVILLHGNKPVPLKQLSAGTQTYFKKLPGYDTLRLILAAKAVLVEGPSDELIVQKAYSLKHGRQPIEDGVDVISVRGLSFARFLEIASALEKEVAVVIDNDGNYDEKVKSRYSEYREKRNIRICADMDNSAKSLEPQLAKCNELQTLNEIFGTKHDDLAALISYMENNKTECALKIFDTKVMVKMPDYIKDAVQ